MAEKGQKSKRHGAYSGYGHSSHHQNPCFQSILQWSTGNQGHLYANLPIRLQES